MCITRLVVCRRVDWVVILLSLWLPCCVKHECRLFLLDVVRFLIGVFVYVCCLYVGCVPTFVGRLPCCSGVSYVG